MALVPVRITPEVPSGSTTIAAGQITTTLTPPGATTKMAITDLHMRVDPTADGAGDVTFTIQYGTFIKRWVRPFVANYGATMDYASEIRGPLGLDIVLTVARAGMTINAEMNWLECQYQGG